jgi:hypothetical protein
MGCPEMLVRNYHSALRKNPIKPRSVSDIQKPQEEDEGVPSDSEREGNLPFSK